MLAPLAGYELALQLREEADRWEAWELARATADRVGRPLLNVGCPRRYPGKYPCGDVCLDNDPWRLAVCRSPRPTLGDVRRIPFPAGYFGAALCSHVLEHLPSVADAERALAELRRVADGRVVLCWPSRYSLAANLHPDHRLWVEPLPDGSVRIEQR